MDDMEATGVIGQHFIVDAYDCNASVIDCADEVKV